MFEKFLQILLTASSPIVSKETPAMLLNYKTHTTCTVILYDRRTSVSGYPL